MSARVVMGAGIDNCESVFPVATQWKCVIRKAAEEAVFEARVDGYDFIYSLIVNHCKLLNFLQLPCCDR